MRRAENLATVICLLSSNCVSLNFLEPSGPVKGLLHLTVNSSKQAGLHCKVTDWLGSILGQDAGYPVRFSVLHFSFFHADAADSCLP
jgi:hypothetical protein